MLVTWVEFSGNPLSEGGFPFLEGICWYGECLLACLLGYQGELLLK